MKPFGQSFTKDGSNLDQSPNPRSKTSLWNYDPPSIGDKLLNNIATLTKFRQSDFTSSVYGETGILFVCLYPPEQGFFRTRLGNALSDVALELVTGLGKPRINYLQANCNYFHDLKNEYRFLLSNENQVVKVAKQNATYKILTSYEDIVNHHPAVDRTLYVIVTIEGAHSFFSGWNSKKNAPVDTDEQVLANIGEVKGWQHSPLFISLAHHFYNGICGHAISMDKFLRRVMDQDYGSDFGISPLGEKVIHKLLGKDPRRILVDVKHMNAKNRFRYYDMLNNDYASENIPIVVSHGAVNGYKDASGSTTFENAPSLFYRRDVNFYDDELVRIAKSRGIFGIQLDERRIASNQMLWSVMGSIQPKKAQYHWAKLVWNQIEHVAKVLDKANLPAWDFACLGSDYDGIVNPLGGYWTNEDIRHLDENLLIYANQFLKKQQLGQKTEPEEIVYKFKCSNALEFLQRNYTLSALGNNENGITPNMFDIAVAN